ncbi:MAG: histidine kinase, partial [Proteobacteria bacterium]
MKGSFKFSPTILIRLGEELVPNPTDGLLELVKNSYDADASYCNLVISKTEISIHDDGDGMTATDLIDGWLLIGGSRKNTDQLTQKLRTPVGNKGLGRLAALRLGDRVIVRSRPRSTPGKEYIMEIPWTEVDNSDFVEKKQFEITESATKKPPGTDIILQDLRNHISENELTEFSRSLVLLSDPFDSTSGFKATLTTPEFSSVNNLARQNFFEDADYHLVASIDESGVPSVRVLDWQDRVRYAAKPKDFEKHAPYRTPPATFELWSFKLSSDNFSAKNSEVKDVRRWLKVRGGVHLYHNNMRVRPFGEPGYDWLEMDRKRA